jgi:hypothetical protein
VKTKFASVIAVALGTAVLMGSAAFAEPVGIISSAAISRPDTFNWSQLGANLTQLSGSQNVTSAGGLAATVSSAGNVFEIVNEGVGAAGNFPPGMALLWDRVVGPDITITLAKPVRAIGAQIQSDVYGAFTAQITAYGQNGAVLGSFSESGTSTSSNDGSAIFIGLQDTAADIYKIQFILTSAISNPNDFAIGTLYVSPTGAVNAHDFNGDGYSDIAWRDTSGDAAMWLMNGTQSIGAWFGAAATTWSIAGQRDFDGDGKADFLWRDTSGNVAIWFFDGAYVSSTAGVGNVPTSWSIVGTGDFNGDGKGDILWRDSSGNVAVWEMNGATILNPNTAGVGNVPTTWSIVGTGDFNGDGYADILWRDTSGNVAIWEMNGTTVLNPNTAGVGNVPTTWSIVGTGDFNGDGMWDILWRDTSGNVAIWEMNGTTVLNPNAAGVGNVPTTWSIVETGDFNGDGKSDILWHDTGGDVAMWFMNGTTVLNPNAAGVATMPTVWTIQGTDAD